MITTPRPPSVHSTTNDADPFSAFLRPPTSETEHERVDRLRREADAKRVSDNIDEEIKADRERLRKSKQDIRVSFASHALSFPSPPGGMRSCSSHAFHPSVILDGLNPAYICPPVGIHAWLVRFLTRSVLATAPWSGRIWQVHPPEAVPTALQPWGTRR